MLDDSNEIITYTYDTANEYITRTASCGVANPFLGDTTASGRPRGVKVINNTLGIPIFKYYDASGAATASIPDIRRIEITLVVEIDETGFTYTTTGTQKRRLVYSTSVIPRNHGITY
ncbi:MAG TPA: hypothetical protein DHV16_04225 [Nitrospiraceae bacterium]|nr:hypothetical protein [Nitrospiraceae bacterium]